MVHRALPVLLTALGQACAVIVGFNEVPIAGRIAAGAGAVLFSTAALWMMITTPTLPTPKKLTGIANHRTLPYARRRVSSQRSLKKGTWAHLGVVRHMVGMSTLIAFLKKTARYNNGLDWVGRHPPHLQKNFTELHLCNAAALVQLSWVGAY